MNGLDRTIINMNVIEKKVNLLDDFICRKEELKETHPLRYLFWEATLRCNLDCLHCGSDCVKDNSTLKDEIHIGKIKEELKTISEFYPPERITFAIIGGEPLIRKEIIEVGAFAAELGYFWGITTNGMLLNLDNIKLLKDARLKTISVSLDGNEENHDKLRNCPGSYKIVTEAIRNLIKDPFYKKFDVICCVSKINIDHLEEFLRILLELRVPAVRFVPVFSQGRASKNTHLMLESGDYRKLLSWIGQNRKSQKQINISLGEEGYYGPEWECAVRDSFHYCASGILIGSILYDGKVTGCPSISREFIEGNIKDSSFLDIWENKFSRYRQDRKKMFPEECGNCEHWPLCEGGGFHLLNRKKSDDRCIYKKINKEGFYGKKVYT